MYAGKVGAWETTFPLPLLLLKFTFLLLSTKSLSPARAHSSLHADFDLRKFQSTSDIGIERNVTVNN